MILDWLTDWKLWAGLINGAFVLAVAYYTWFRQRDSDIKGEIKEGDTSIDRRVTELDNMNREKFSRVHFRIDEMSHGQAEHGHRLSRLETTIANLPSHNDIGVLHKKLGVMQKEVTAALTVANQTNDLVKTINSYLIQREER